MLILVDSCVWINHFKCNDKTLTSLLHSNQVLIHPFVIGELVCGGIPDETLSLLRDLPGIQIADDNRVINFTHRHRTILAGILDGQGKKKSGSVGYIDMHLLLSAELAKKKLWTVDKKLHAVAKEFNLIC